MTDPNGAAIYGAPWIPSIYPLYVSIYTSTMDPMGIVLAPSYPNSENLHISYTMNPSYSRPVSLDPLFSQPVSLCVTCFTPVN